MIKDLDKFKEEDIYSLSMFVLYKLIDCKEYSTLSELSYILDRKNLINLCKYFGGLTIKIPTLEELRSITSVLLLYQYTQIEGMSYNDAISLLKPKIEDNQKTKLIYLKICNILKDYDIKVRNLYE